MYLSLRHLALCVEGVVGGIELREESSHGKESF